MNNQFRLYTVDFNEGHRGEPKLFVNEGIIGNITDVIQRLEEGQKPGDNIFDLRSLRNIHGEFAILRTSHRDADNNKVRDILNENSGLIRIRLGEILSFKIFEGPFLRVWVTFDKKLYSKVSWGLFKSGQIDHILSKRLEYSVRVREGKLPTFDTKMEKPKPLEKSVVQTILGDEWSPSQALTVVQNDSVDVNDFDLDKVDLTAPTKTEGRQTPKATRRTEKPVLRNGTQG